MKLDKNIVHVATTIVILVACALVSILSMPVYYAMLSDAMPPSMAVKVKRSTWLPKDGVNITLILLSMGIPFIA